MLLHIVLFLVGLVLLIVGADKLVDGGSALAKRLNIPPMVIGLTIVAFGTSSPELVVSLVSATQGNADIALGNVLGSNIFNILVILGITSIIYPLHVNCSTTWVEVPLTLLSAVMVFLVVWNGQYHGFGTTTITRPDGMILLCFFMIFMAYTLHLSKSGGLDNPEIREMSFLKSSLFILIGLAGLVVGGEMLVRGAVNMATRFGIPERIIGLTIVAIGTSAPELATSIIAARKKSVDMAIGNIIGSNLFNIFLILGVTTAITPIHVDKKIMLDIIVNIGASLLLFFAIFLGKGRQISRIEGIIFLLVYLVFLSVLL